ncbi:MAG: RNA-binding protein [Eubacterium sp.]|nr:RNA-binding protein [Eubacterium sp.]
MQIDTTFLKHLNDLYERAETRKTPQYSEFLNLYEISLLIAEGLPCRLFGGYCSAERRIACFGDGDDYPIVCIKAEPKNEKFSDRLTHRDYLGTVTGCGVDRSRIGDILLDGNTAYIFCHSSISDYILQSIDRVKHTSVKLEKVSEIPELITAQPELTAVNVSALRLDAVTAAVFKLPRSEASKLIKSEQVFINSRLETKESKTLNDGDTVSVRGHGRFIFEGVLRKTKKDRLFAEVRIYK